MNFNSVKLTELERIMCINAYRRLDCGESLKECCDGVLQYALMLYKGYVIKHSKKHTIDIDFIKQLEKTLNEAIQYYNKKYNLHISCELEYPVYHIFITDNCIVHLDKKWIKDEKIQEEKNWCKYKGFVSYLDGYIEQLKKTDVLTPISDFICSDFFDYVNSYKNELLYNDALRYFSVEDSHFIVTLYWFIYLFNHSNFCHSKLNKVFTLLKSKEYPFNQNKIKKIYSLNSNYISFDFATGSRITIYFKDDRIERVVY